MIQFVKEDSTPGEAAMAGRRMHSEFGSRTWRSLPGTVKEVDLNDATQVGVHVVLTFPVLFERLLPA